MNRKKGYNSDFKSNDYETIRELNYMTSPKEEAEIEQYKQEIVKMGYNRFQEVNDLHQFFWELSRQSMVCGFLMRIAITDLITNASVIPVFLGMAKRYNGWMQTHLNESAIEKRRERIALNKLEEKERTIQSLEWQLSETRKEMDKHRSEAEHLQKEIKNMFSKHEMDSLRHELKKEYHKKVHTIRDGVKASKLTARRLRKILGRPSSRFLSSYDLCNEEDINEYIEWFRLMNRPIKANMLGNIRDAYSKNGIMIDEFERAVEAYNRDWSEKHQADAESAPEDEDMDIG